MNEGTQVVENLIFSYRNQDGLMCYTPNSIFAQARATQHGTENVFVEVVPTEE